jgi:FkbM family methyltransferase
MWPTVAHRVLDEGRGQMAASKAIADAELLTRDPEARHIRIVDQGALGQLKMQLLKRLRTSPMSWRFNFTVQARYGTRTLKIPIIYGRGFQNLDIGEAWFFRALSRLLTCRSGAFLDVGVNLGQTLIKVKLIEPTREYIGFEPNPQCCQYTSQLIEANRFQRCTLVPVGLADSARMLTLFAKDDAVDPSASIVPGFRAPERYRRSQHAAVFAGDEVVKDLSDLGFVKVDVEGGELEVIAGLQATIERFTPFIFCEILPVFDEQSDVGQFRKRRQERLLEILKPMGYSLFRLLYDGSAVELSAIRVHRDISLSNYLLVPPADLNNFRQLFPLVTQSVAERC